ncbi:PSD1 and planctomycete cytochrome C domain-containing protein [Verrucomicrobia bacterium]|jgi:hypothetical protein|nr:PSD1 and planctomycete cytochrome C domain-containing protein [Verrucomicrobiota bacterium]
MKNICHIFITLVFAVFFETRLFASDSAIEASSHAEFFESKIRPLLVNRCYECHSGNAKRIKAGLRLDSREAILRGGDSGSVIVEGKPEESLLIKLIRADSKEKMPPEGKRGLNESEIEALSEWVRLGAPWTKSSKEFTPESGYDWARMRQHWSWKPVKRVAPPSVAFGAVIKNAIDRFVVAGLERGNLKQPESASATVFVRRVFLDLLGLPPSPEEWTHWVGRIDSDSDGNLDDLVVGELLDELLGREQYGERWGRHWLDVARYSDVGGWSQDNRARPKAWQYRDWVVRSFNRDMPYNEFVRNQIVGDKMGRDEAVGTGFFALGPNYSSDGGDPDSIAQAKSETLDDRVDTFSRAFLGMTVSCARCHDHKFDPIPIEDYYSIAGVFNNAGEGDRPLVDDSVVKRYHDHQRPIRELKDRIDKLRREARDGKRELDEKEKRQIEVWEEESKVLKSRAPAKFEFAHALHDRDSKDMNVALRGKLLKPGPLAPRRFLRIIAGEEREHFSQGSGRQQLAAAVVDPSNPLTARVMVNRVWMHHFGRALVRTPSNFGMLGEAPTHPELLDWLADVFVESGWSIKSLHRLIMSSAAYRSSSAFEEAAFELEGDNRSLWRMNPRRMDAETWRDSLMAVTGELDGTLGGPAIDDIVRSRRRTLYAKVSRNNPLASDEYLRLFDFPIPRATSAKRTESVVPQQFLFMMNSEFMMARAKALAARLHDEVGSNPGRIESAYRLLHGRSPSEPERRAGLAYVDSESPRDSVLSRWQQYCQVLLSSNEFMYIR